MSLDTVVEDIREEARERAEEIRAAAEDEASAIVDEAESDAAEIVASAETEVEREVDQLREQRISSARLEAKQQRLEARRDVLDEVRDAAEDRLASLEAGTREELTRALLDAASPEFGDDDSVHVYASETDQELLEDVLDDYDGYDLAGTYDCLGGVVLESEQSRVRVNNTLDSVLETVWDEELRRISDKLFEQ